MNDKIKKARVKSCSNCGDHICRAGQGMSSVVKLCDKWRVEPKAEKPEGVSVEDIRDYIDDKQQYVTPDGPRWLSSSLDVLRGACNEIDSLDTRHNVMGNLYSGAVDTLIQQQKDIHRLETELAEARAKIKELKI